KRYNAVPFAKEENVLFVAMADPRDIFAVEDIQLRTGLEIQPYLALPEDIREAMSKVYGTEEEAALSDEEETEAAAPTVSQADFSEDAKELTAELLAGLDTSSELQVDKTAFEESSDIMQIDASAPEVEKLVNAVILEAVRLKASDIHIEPFEKKLSVRYRVDGNLRRASFKIPMVFKQALMAKIKIMGGMNITERRIPQDGRIQVKAKGKSIEFRVNVVPTVFGESAVMRILDRSGATLTLDQLGILPDTLQKFMGSLNKPYGLILVTGPTGSGKSFTLTSALSTIRDPEEKVLTAENPVEYNLEGVVQVQVNPDLKMGPDKVFDFATALRAFLRQDPDVIMVGEIRDRETAQIAMEAAMTGHLVLSTLHTNDAPSSITRLSEMGVHTFLIANTLEAVLAQRLISTLCKNCKEPDPNPPAELLKTLEGHKIDYSKATFMKPKGCPKCGNRGMKGRTAIHELLVMDEDLRRLCVKEMSVGPLRDMAISHGMRTLVQDGLIKVTMGVTTYEEIMGAAT
ncbi:MAG: Flp pilus assembly complex ATPase component TadA, partial [Elusimicrobia bacterium]|nr:Flp pilus assembly complex ATPase component TadA [Elusimicrobiota bacterium]